MAASMIGGLAAPATSAVAASGASCALIIFDSAQRPALWMTAVLVTACYALHRIRQGGIST